MVDGFDAAISLVPNGGTLNVNSGTYTINRTIRLFNKNGITLNFVPGAKLFAANGLNSNMLAIGECNNVNIVGIELDGNKYNQQIASNVYPDGVSIGIFLGYAPVDNVVIKNANIYNVRQFGIQIGYATTTNSGIRDSVVHDSGWNDIQFGENVDYGYAINNEVYNSSDVGITVFANNPTGHILIDSNYVHDITGLGGSGGSSNTSPGSNWAIATEVCPGSQITITNNTIANAKILFFNTQVQGVMLSNNIFGPTTGVAVYASGGSTNIVNNDFTGITDPTAGWEAAVYINAGATVNINGNNFTGLVSPVNKIFSEGGTVNIGSNTGYP